MKQSFRYCLLACFFAAFVGCGDEEDPYTDPDLDCQDEAEKDDDCEECTDACDEDCDVAVDPQFDFENYTASCDAADEVPEFCGPSASSDCVEPSFDVEEATVAGIHAALEAEEISCEWLTHEYLRRIMWHDLHMPDGEPPLNAFVHLNEQAMKTARTLDEFHRCEERLTGPLHCAPFAIKTNYGSKEVPVTNGSLALKDTQPEFDAFTVHRLRQAGAIMIGSTSMDEFAAGVHSFSGRSGKTGNAFDTTLNSGGSSSGAAVAPASNLAMAGLGTDNCASLMIPAAYNGLFTMRSSHQLVSTEGIFPSNRLDAVSGPMTRTAEDMVLFFNEMAAFNPHYGPHCAEDIERDDDYTAALNPDGLQGKRVGILRALNEDPDAAIYPFDGASAEVEEHFEAFFEELEDQGVELVEGIELDELPLDRTGSGSGYDAKVFLEKTTGGVSNFEELCETELYSQSVFDSKDACLNRGDQSKSRLESNVESGLATYRSNREYVETVLDEYELDAVVYPVDRQGAATPQYVDSVCFFAAVTGLPTVVVPTGHTSSGLPIGMSFTGRMFDDAMLLEMAYGYEQATFHRQAPPMASLGGEPPFADIEEFNQIHYEIGLAAFEEVLRDHSKFDLNASRFADIAAAVLANKGFDELLE